MRKKIFSLLLSALMICSTFTTVSADSWDDITPNEGEAEACVDGADHVFKDNWELVDNAFEQEGNVITRIYFYERRCTVCDMETEYAYEEDVINLATCTKGGYIEHIDKNHHSSFTSQTSPLGHVWSSWKTSVEPTTEKEGKKVRECLNCHEKETETIKKLEKVVTETKQEEAGKIEQKENKEKTPTTNNSTSNTTKTKKTVKVRKVSVNKKKATLKKGKTFKIKATVLPKNATNKKVTYKSSNKKIATVTKTGKIKAKKKGKCTITVISKDGNKKAKIKVTVK